jgi:hypothetical protein
LNTKIFSLLSFALFAVGCGSGSNNKNTPESAAVAGPYKIEDFFYHTSGRCEEENLYFHYLSSKTLMLADATDGKKMRGIIEVFLQPNNTYVALYEEHKVHYFTNSGYAYDVTVSKRLNGGWRMLKDGQVEIKGLGLGRFTSYNDSPAIWLTFYSDISSQGLVGQDTFLRKVHSSFGGLESPEEYCRAN